MSAALRVLIVDDEPLARDNLRLLLERDPGVRVVGECGDGDAATEALLASGVDVVFLDVQMPRVSGLEVIASVGFERMPVVVFVTAYDEYALQAFEHRALDFLLKPFSDERFETVLARAKENVRDKAAAQLATRLAAIVADLGEGAGAARSEERLPLKADGRLIRLDPAEIDWIEAADYRLRIHRGGETLELRKTMAELERVLDPRAFLRVHRSAIVNLRRVRELTRGESGEATAVLEDGTRVRVARSHRRELERRLSGEELRG